MKMLDQLKTIEEDALATLAAAHDAAGLEGWRVAVLGRKGSLTHALRGLGQLPRDERPAAGAEANRVKDRLEAAFSAHQEVLQQAEIAATLAAEAVDVTLPGRPPSLGRIHPSNAVLRRIYAIFGQMGFQVYDAPDVELDEINFQLLNIPPDHPARDMQDTFYTKDPAVLLRTHTSPGQIRAMRQFAPAPLRVILPGKCFRYEQVTARSEFMFHQVEGLAVGKGITMADLKGTLQEFANQLYGEGRQLRFRCSYFPFVEPGVEVDMDCILCGGRGCRLCKYSGWLEISGAGMVHPVVLRNGGYDPEVYTGFAFGMGPERITMLKHSIDDIRYFFSNDVRFLEQF
ncbi:phenylalanine--tRNA ligase subunit alpha [Candidatus Amarolinea dominans]|uniref:phenylalanine--tRNA ligase subunit alpha n=1 Tax=Candidatus Amarolinea dominans TaxID=3140696 RepID=UPI00313503E6|nr:phenylalanine--tRNA ligase subunit alpha [Anaerolineae bacterium]